MLLVTYSWLYLKQYIANGYLGYGFTRMHLHMAYMNKWYHKNGNVAIPQGIAYSVMSGICYSINIYVIYIYELWLSML